MSSTYEPSDIFCFLLRFLLLLEKSNYYYILNCGMEAPRTHFHQIHTAVRDHLVTDFQVDIALTQLLFSPLPLFPAVLLPYRLLLCFTPFK